MTQTTIGEKRPPFPRLGECYRALALALDTKAGNRDVDRLAREGDYDWLLLTTLREKLIKNPLGQASDDEFAELVSQFIDRLHADYLRLVANIPLDSLNRKEALPLLVEHYFAPQGTGLLLGIKQTFDGPDLMALLDPSREPIEVTLDWFDKNGGRTLAETAFPESTGTDRPDRELITRWTSGTQLPDLQSIRRFIHALLHRGGVSEKEIAPNLQRWMIAARALSWLEKKSPLPFRSFMRRHLLLGLPGIDIGKVFSLANIQGGKRFVALVRPALMLYEDLKRTTPKASGDKERIKQSLDTFQQLSKERDPEGRTWFHVAWLNGLWYVLSGQFEQALPYYKEAVELANYRAGDQQKHLVEEALVLAAIVGGQKPLLKSLKHRAVAFGLFTNPRGDDVIEDWEIDHLQQQFHRIFPHRGRFPEALEAEGRGDHLPFLTFGEKNLTSLEPDLRKPNRVRSVRALDGQVRRWPQLHIFASEGQFDKVRELLRHGASVDQLDKAGGSALLFAIQHVANGGNRQPLDLLLEQPHTNVTLDRATNRKRHTPLICAVQFGEPDIVERLLSLGASADRRGQIDDVTPLYRCMNSLKLIQKPTWFYQHMHQKMLADPDNVGREVLRRYNISPGGVFGDDKALHYLLSDPQYQAIVDALANATVKKEIDRLTEPKLIRIVELLLKAGANPNAVHKYPAPGRTPMMLAAENDSVESFELMMQYGGNPHQREAQGLDCIRIAIGFRSHNVIEYMRNNGIL